MSWENEPGRFYEYSDPEEFLLNTSDLVNNANPLAPVLICVDCSFSMRQHSRLNRVLEGIESFRQDILSDPVARDSLELGIVAFGGKMAREVMPFCSAEQAKIPQLVADGATPLADAVRTALEVLRRRREQYQRCGNECFRPWLIIIGDDDDDMSAPGELEEMARILRREYDQKHLNVLCITVGDEEAIQYASLARLAPDGQVYYLRDLKFREFFSWLSRSIEKTSQSMQGEEILLAPTTTWGEVKKLEARR